MGYHPYQLTISTRDGVRVFSVDLPVTIGREELTEEDLEGFTDRELLNELDRRARMREE